jgi:hypothetical protein
MDPWFMNGKEDVMATTETFVPGRLYEMPMTKLQHDPNQPRKYIDPAAIDELIASLREHGVIKPILSINRLPKEIRDICRQDTTVPNRTLIEITGKKQERSMLTQFRKYQEQQAKAAAKGTEAAAPAERKRTRAESLVNNIGIWSSKIGDLEFPDFSKEERTSIIDAMNSLKETLDEAIPRAVKNKKKLV